MNGNSAISFTAKELREKKKKEVIRKIENLEDELDNTQWNRNNIDKHTKTLKELYKLYSRRKALKDFLSELDDGRRLIRRDDEVMVFEEMH